MFQPGLAVALAAAGRLDGNVMRDHNVITHEGVAMKAKIVRIGNSRGIRLPKALMEQVGLVEEVELDVRNGDLVISPVTRVREGWAEAAREAADRTDDLPLDEPLATAFDEDEWEW